MDGLPISFSVGADPAIEPVNGWDEKNHFYIPAARAPYSPRQVADGLGAVGAVTQTQIHGDEDGRDR